MALRSIAARIGPQQSLYLRPLPHGHALFLAGFLSRLVACFLLPCSPICKVFVLSFLSSMVWLCILSILPWPALCLIIMLCWLINRARCQCPHHSALIVGYKYRSMFVITGSLQTPAVHLLRSLSRRRA